MELNSRDYAKEIHAAPEEFLEIDEWRERTLVRVLRVGLMLAVIGSLPYTYFTQKLAAHSVELRQQEITRLKREIEAMKHWANQTPQQIAAKDYANPIA